MYLYKWVMEVHLERLTNTVYYNVKMSTYKTKNITFWFRFGQYELAFSDLFIACYANKSFIMYLISKYVQHTTQFESKYRLAIEQSKISVAMYGYYKKCKNWRPSWIFPTPICLHD